MVVAGTEITLRPNLPFCSTCKPTSSRHPVGSGSKLLISLLLFFALLISLAFMPNQFNSMLPSSFALPILFFVACGLVFGYYSLRKPVGKQTSYYQPVRLKKVKQKFSGEIVGYVFAFTNSGYAQDFIAENREVIAKKAIEVHAA
jgi:hypothetical protein